AAGFSPRVRVVLALCGPLLRRIGTVGGGEFYLQAIAVDEELRGEGVGTALMDWIEDRAAASGSVRLTLDVSAGNERARRIYDRRGMVVISRWPKRLALPGLRFVRMTKPL
ncbi:MAG: GNAT family N-acetyltransferase, partial [bacterium]|nr:GNAT family N-acetyltransferase [bacterium]